MRTVLRGLAARATTPLLPDDYLKLLTPLWSARERRGLVVDVRKGISDAAIGIATVPLRSSEPLRPETFKFKRAQPFSQRRTTTTSRRLHA